MLLCISVVLIIAPEVFTASVAIITITIVPLITTDASINPYPSLPASSLPHPPY